MMNPADSLCLIPEDPFHLSRFLSAQEGIYQNVLVELRNGQKRTHWMWFIFPQISGLGHSETAKHYAIKSLEEARQYLAHPVLGARLLECAKTVFAIEGRTVSEIFGYPDDVKLRSCLTLFGSVAGPQSIFTKVLDKYFNGEKDGETLRLLKIWKNAQGS
jgi:uncharacterized protein (DUF1810 family)